MNIFVCIKQVPDTETKIKILGDSSGIDTTSVKWVMNPYDEYAVEEALKLKEAHTGSRVVVFTLGPQKRVGDVLRTALAMGADDGVIIDAPENLDSLTTAKALAAAIKSEGEFRIILTGTSAIDDNASSVGPMLANRLSLPHVSAVSKMNLSGDTVVAEREIEGGSKEVFEIKGPALVAATKGLNSPRYASLPGIMKAKKKVLKELSLQSLGVPAEQHSSYSQFETPPDKPAVRILTGDLKQQVGELVRLLRDESKAL